MSLRRCDRDMHRLETGERVPCGIKEVITQGEGAPPDPTAGELHLEGITEAERSAIICFRVDDGEVKGADPRLKSRALAREPCLIDLVGERKIRGEKRDSSRVSVF